MKQTAVEWLIEQISSSKYFYNLMEEIESRNTTVQPNVLQQAKVMEKEQIVNAYDTGEYDCGCNGDSEQYYNKTFKQE
jgi:hypothetical protein